MMKRLYYALICSLIFCGVAFSQNYLPKSGGEVVAHNFYTLSYSEPHEQAEWVYYTITPSSLSGTASRSDNFREDPRVSTGSATLEDYRGSGYDRGHMCPAASMSRSTLAMSESFFMSNMSPQAPSFNRGAWKQLEERVRELALRDSVLHVVTGPIFTSPIGSIGSNNVTVPRHYYKVLYSEKKGEMVAFVMENTTLSSPLESYICSVDHVEQLTGIDFFASLSREVQQKEAVVNVAAWKVVGSAPKIKSTASSSTKTEAQSTQCKAKTSSGSQCKRTAESGSDYCWQHKQK